MRKGRILETLSFSLGFWLFFKVGEVQIQLKFDEKFIRLWEYYLTSCSSSFTNERTNVYQFTLQKT